jgi:hypothetical protein
MQGISRRVLVGCLILLGFLSAATTYAAGPPPLITVQPLSISVLKNDNATFTVIAVSATTLSYQWKKNGQNISGATQATYGVSQAKSDATYCVDVVNAGGLVTSTAASLHVIKNESDNRPLVINGSKMTPLGFQLQLSGPAPATYVIYASSNSVDWFPISTNTTTTGIMQFTDVAALTQSQRFYHAVAR